jgi:hypothetical protein
MESLLHGGWVIWWMKIINPSRSGFLHKKNHFFDYQGLGKRVGVGVSSSGLRTLHECGAFVFVCVCMLLWDCERERMSSAGPVSSALLSPRESRNLFRVKKHKTWGDLLYEFRNLLWMIRLVSVTNSRLDAEVRWSQVCTFMHPPAAACQRIGPVVLHTLWNHRENLWESLVVSLLVRSTVCFSVHVLNTRCPTAAVAHNSCPSWLCSRNPSPPHRYEAVLRCWENQVMWFGSCLL